MDAYSVGIPGISPALPAGQSSPEESPAAPPVSASTYQERMQAAATFQAQYAARAAADTARRAQRPGCVTAYAILLAAAGGLVALGSLFLAASGDLAVWAMVFALAAGAGYIALARGLWRLKNWARVTVLVVQSLGALFGVIGFMAMLVAGRGDGLLTSLPSLIVGGIIIYWFADNGYFFQ